MFAWVNRLLDFLFGNSKGRTAKMTQANEMEHPAKHQAKPGTPVICDVFALGGGQFRHEWRFQGGPNEGNTAIDIPEKKLNEDATPIQFHFHPDGTGLQFDTGYDADGICKSIWVSQTTCPTSASEDGEITINTMSPNLLRITDANRNKCTLHYNLRFTPNPDQNCYDPDIKNGGSK